MKIIELCKNRTKATLVLTLIIEAITLFFRFGLGLESTRDTASTVGRLTFGIRIHHGYIGLALLIATFFFSRLKKHRYVSCIQVAGASLLLSDIIHHIILFLVTGSSDFDLVYSN
jgi:hypothetical protein